LSTGAPLFVAVPLALDDVDELDEHAAQIRTHEAIKASRARFDQERLTRPSFR
jgi:hypothetical protein